MASTITIILANTHVQLILRIILASLFGALIGVEREHAKRPAGLRTHVLVCVGSCLVMLTSEFVYLHYHHDHFGQQSTMMTTNDQNLPQIHCTHDLTVLYKLARAACPEATLEVDTVGCRAGKAILWKVGQHEDTQDGSTADEQEQSATW